jgi:tyrosyl-tRNA synthetase
MVQGYDFLHLFRENETTIQMGGSDQWGNITTGTELIRRIGGGKGYAITCPLITKSDGSKFGKSEGGNVWLDAKRTSAYKFYQYWLNTTDEDAEKYIKIFTFLDKETINALVKEHKEAPHTRVLQKRLGEEVTVLVHGKDEYEKAIAASNILFGKSNSEDLKSLDEQTFLDVFDGVPQATVSSTQVGNGLDMIAALSAETNFLKSNGDARRALKENAISVNKEKIKDDFKITTKDLIAKKYVLLQRGKKTYFLLIVE